MNDQPDVMVASPSWPKVSRLIYTHTKPTVTVFPHNSIVDSAEVEFVWHFEPW